MNAKIHSFSAECCTEHDIDSFSQSILSSLSQIISTHALGNSHDLLKKIIHQTKPLFPIAPWSSSDAVGTLGGGQGLKLHSPI